MILLYRHILLLNCICSQLPILFIDYNIINIFFIVFIVLGIILNYGIQVQDPIVYYHYLLFL